MLLKGQCHQIFCFWFFPESVSPRAPEYPNRTVRIFCANSQRYLPPVLMTPAANLPRVSTTPVANFATSFASFVDTGGKFATCAAEAFFYCPTMNSHPLVTSKEQALNPEKELRRTWPRCHVSLEKSSKKP
jgi:hypothetical protein